MNWNPNKARKFLDEQLDERAANAGLSDRALARLSALSDPTAAIDRPSFVAALKRAGWSKRRIKNALRQVQVRPLALRVWDFLCELVRHRSFVSTVLLVSFTATLLDGRSGLTVTLFYAAIFVLLFTGNGDDE